MVVVVVVVVGSFSLLQRLDRQKHVRILDYEDNIDYKYMFFKCTHNVKLKCTHNVSRKRDCAFTLLCSLCCFPTPG